MSGGWRRLGRILEAPGGPLARSHVMLPTPLVLDDRIRLFFAACDDDMRGRVFFADLSLDFPHPLIAFSPGPVLDLGGPDAFDADGVNPSQALWIEGRLALIYIGWRRGPPDAPYTLFAALATSDDNGLSFTKAGGPLLTPGPGERQFRTAGFVERDGDGWRMLYVGGDGFLPGADGRPTPLYALMEARSNDLFHWPDTGRTLAAPDRAAGETGFGRPVRWHDDRGAPVTLVSVRTLAGYRLVELRDGPQPHAERMTPVFEPPFDPWESAMTCFGAPCVVGGRELLFYNGDGYGRTGCGLAWRRAVKE